MTERIKVALELSGDLSSHVEGQIMSGNYRDAAEYVRDLIRHDRDRWDAESFERVKAHLQEAFAAPEEDFVESSAEKIIAKYSASK
jgi:Arc/MetJ-type ribon-helix-helix transcriptional regulator